MAALHHSSDEPGEIEHADTIARNTRYGLALFAVYLLLYGAYVFANAFAPELMERTPIAGVNLAILAGFGLIATAFLLALVYGWLCRNAAHSPDASRRDGEEGRT